MSSVWCSVLSDATTLYGRQVSQD